MSYSIKIMEARLSVLDVHYKNGTFTKEEYEESKKYFEEEISKLKLKESEELHNE